MRTIRILGAIALLAAGSAGAQTAADSASVNAFYGRLFASASRGAGHVARVFAADGYILPPGSPPVTGRDAIADWFKRTETSLPYAQRPDDLKVDEIRFLSPDWVIYRSTQHGKRFPNGGGEPVPFETKYVDLLHRTADRGWEFMFRMWSDNR